MTYGMNLTCTDSYDNVKSKLINALKEQGFGILTEINIQATLKEKLDKDMPRYEILGACNPQLADKALEADPSIGLLLPCNVVIREDHGNINVSIIDPEVMFKVVEDTTKQQLLGLPEEAKKRLKNVLEALEGVPI